MEDKELLRENLKYTSNMILQYKASENSKIIQFFHITMVCIAALFSRDDINSFTLISLALATALMGISYAFFFLYDLNSFTVTLNEFLDGQTSPNAESIMRTNSLSLNVKNSRFFMAIAVMLAYTCIIAAIVSLVKDVEFNSFQIAIMSGLFILIIYIFGKAYHRISKITGL